MDFNLNKWLLFCFFIVNFLWHNILHANSEVKNNKLDEFIRLKYKHKLHLGKKKKKKREEEEEKYKNMGVSSIVWDLIIGMTLMVKRDFFEKLQLYIYENFDKE